MKISDEDREALLPVVAEAIRHAYVTAAGGSDFEDSLAGDIGDWHGEASAAIDAILASDVFKQMMREESLAYRSVERDTALPWNDDRLRSGSGG